MHSVPSKIPELNCPINSFACLRPTTLLVIPLSQHYTVTVTIVFFLRQKVKLYEKASFVHYSTEIYCTSLRYPNDYNYSLLIDLAVLPD